MSASGDQARADVWQTIGLAGSTVLEIGPGAGHVLAAAKNAGRQIWGVETNPAHRAYITQAWGITTVVPALSNLPPDLKFDTIIAVNVLEHVHDIRGFLHDLCARLTPTGSIFISTSNAACIVPQVVGTWWSMFKEVDHVAFPTAAGMSAAAAVSGLTINRVWTSELPLETPIGFVVAIRDYLRSAYSAKHPPRVEAPVPQDAKVSDHQPLSRRIVHRIYRVGKRGEPSSRLIGRLGRAASIKVVLTQNVDPMPAGPIQGGYYMQPPRRQHA
ncbi:class I SAM-dependent methyltransferase [Frankia sp. Cppng1_Ct_nod]|uniref:class I SAM-dependent methyltransferase n=1 Tax=Frankia sp. Cppng1_Ct_nod TaxID=2897162 RepID=UPI0013EFA311|nr:class I SAM-dependent methyltransferase [Frankia sp. Cppng1_Ct_nod]